MFEEQESLSLSKDITDTNNDTDTIDETEDTIKIQRVKLPLNGYSAAEIHKKELADAINQSLPENENGHVSSADAINPYLPGNGNCNGYEPECSVTVHQPFFEELTLEETAKLPVSGSNGHRISAKNGNANRALVSQENEVAHEPDATHIIAIEEQDDENIAILHSSLRQTSPSQQQVQSSTTPYLLRPVARLWNFSRVLCIVLMLIPIILLCFIGYMQLNHFQSNIYTVDAHTGAVLWQRPATGAEQTELVDAQGSVQVVTLANNKQRVVALDAHGTTLWQSFSSDGIFALPPVHSATGTVLVTLSEQVATGNSLTLYSFTRATGHIIWRYDITQPAHEQGSDIVGADTNFIYALRDQSVTNQQAQVQLLAINQYTGYAGWRLSSPAEVEGDPPDAGTLLLAGHTLVWQVEATIEVIDPTQGNVQWTGSMPYSNISTLQQEEAQMVIMQGQLVVERSDALHAFDMRTGKKLWNMSVFDFSTGTTPAHIAVAGQVILVYGNGQLGAIAVSNQKILWQQRQVGEMLGFHVSMDGTLIYVILLDSVENSVPAQALVALNAHNGGAMWTFQPSDQFTFFHPQSDGFQYSHSIILTTLCSTASCTHPHLYALNATTGATLWKFEGNGVSNPLMGIDGNVVSYEGNTSAWQQFIQGLNG